MLACASKLKSVGGLVLKLISNSTSPFVPTGRRTFPGFANEGSNSHAYGLPRRHLFLPIYGFRTATCKPILMNNYWFHRILLKDRKYFCFSSSSNDQSYTD